MFVVLDTVVQFQYWTIEISDPDNLNGFLQAGYLMLGAKQTFDFGFNYGWDYIDEFYNLRYESELGAIDAFPLFDRVVISLRFDNLTEEQGRAYRFFFRSVSRGQRTFFFLPEVDGVDGHFGRVDPKLTRKIGFAKRAGLGFVFTEDSRGKIVTD